MFLLIAVILFFAKFEPVFSASSPAPSVVINNIPDNSLAGSNFSVDFTVTNAEVGTSFYYKIFGGAGDNTSSIQTYYNSNYLNYTSSWTDFPVLVIGDTAPLSTTVAGRSNNSAGNYTVKVRIAKVTNTGSKYDSEAKTIDIIAPSPTPTLIPTSVPTLTPVPTAKPTLVPTIVPTVTPVPTLVITPTLFSTPVPSLTLVPEPTSSPVPSPQVLSAADSKSKSNKFGIILIIIGGLLLLSPLLISKLNKRNKASSV